MTAHVPLLLNGEFIQSTSSNLLDVVNPATQEVLAKVPLATNEEIETAISGAQAAFELWKEVPVSEKKGTQLSHGHKGWITMQNEFTLSLYWSSHTQALQH